MEIKGSNIPGLRQALDAGLRLESRQLGSALETVVPTYANPQPLFRTTFLDADGLRISRDQDGKLFVYSKLSDSTTPTESLKSNACEPSLRDQLVTLAQSWLGRPLLAFGRAAATRWNVPASHMRGIKSQWPLQGDTSGRGKSRQTLHADACETPHAPSPGAHVHQCLRPSRCRQ